jgi:hypothetical protein
MSFQMTQYHHVMYCSSWHIRSQAQAIALDGNSSRGIQGFDCIDINLNNMQQRVADCEGVSPVVLGGSHQHFRQYHPRLRSVYMISIACRKAWLYGSAYRCGQVEHCLPGYEGLLMIVLDLHIYNMYNAIEFTSSR